MEKRCSDLKKISKLLMIIIVYQVVNLMLYFNAVSTLDVGMVDAATQAMIPVVKVVGTIPYLLSILVYAFLCFKGHQEADDPSPAKLHIILAFIWMIGAVLSIFNAVSMMTSGVSLMKAVDLLAAVAAVVLLFFYGKYAKEIRAVE